MNRIQLSRWTRVHRIALASLVWFAACRDLPPAPSRVPVRPTRANRSTNAVPTVRTIDDDFADLADRVPGFGGMFYNAQGRLTIYSTNGSLTSLDRSQVLAVLRRHHPGKPQLAAEMDGATVLRAAYDYRQLLSAYRGPLNTLFTKTNGLVLTDIDESHNRITVGVSDSTAAGRARDLFDANGFGSDFVVVEVVGIPTPNSALTDPLRPVPGGAAMFLGSSSGVPCTQGFNLVKYMGTFSDTIATARFFTTASHCTSSQWSLDYSQGFQGGSFYASEIGDPGAFSSAPCDSGKLCRYSDASLFQFYDDSITSLDGSVAYPADTATLTFSSYVTMVDTPTPYDGEIVHMIGAASGRPRGNVLASCANISNITGWGNKELLCQTKSSYFSQSGDSGAPVIALYTGTTGGALGLHWGNTAVNGHFAYSWSSPMYSALQEFFDGLSGAPNLSPVVY